MIILLQLIIIILTFAPLKTKCATIFDLIIIMSIGRSNPKVERKKVLFEYLVFLLEGWKNEKHPHIREAFTKLKLQKILFLVASVNANEDNHPLLDVFNNFYALPYGPVEMDIYDAMCNNSFKNIQFKGNDCINSSLLGENIFNELDENLKYAMQESIRTIKDAGADYIITSPFELVDITHKWTTWQIAIQMAEMFGNKRESMPTDDIINSTVKAFK